MYPADVVVAGVLELALCLHYLVAIVQYMAHIINTPEGEDQGPLLSRVSVAVYIIAVLFIALRFLTRGWIVRKYGLDDGLIAVAVSLGAAQTATILVQVKHGRGRHAGEISVHHYNHMLMFEWINMLVYYLANWAVKMSILALYHRIGSGQKGLPLVLRSGFIWTVASVTTAFTAAVFLTEVFTCTPIWRVWDIENMGTGCIKKTAFTIWQASTNVFIDLVLLLFPLPLLRILKINTKQRSALVVIFSIGVIPLIASIMRLCEIVMAAPSRRVSSFRDSDSSWRWAWVPVWSQIEVDVSIVAASLPSLSPLLKKVWAGFATQRTTALSQIPTLAGPQESRDLQPLPSHSSSSMVRSGESKHLTFFDTRKSEDASNHDAFLRPYLDIENTNTADTSVVPNTRDTR